MATSLDPDETLHSAASHLGLHCLLRPVRIHTVNMVHLLSRVMLGILVLVLMYLYSTELDQASPIVLVDVLTSSSRGHTLSRE